MPALNFAYHCETPVSQEYPFLLRCPKIEEGIKECQKRGKKVLMSIGGATGDGTLPSTDKAKEFAHTLYDLFLGGSGYADIRPFGKYVWSQLLFYFQQYGMEVAADRGKRRWEQNFTLSPLSLPLFAAKHKS